MPTYEYRCEACGAQYDREQRITEDAIPECLECGEPRAMRLVGTGHFILKGGGWYADLYSSQPRKDAKSSEGRAEPKPEAKSESKPAESKPAESKPAKTEPKKASSSD